MQDWLCMFDSLPSCPRHSEKVAPVLIDTSLSSSLPPCFMSNCAQRIAKEWVKPSCSFNVSLQLLWVLTSVSCWERCDSNSISKVFILHPLLVDRGCIAKQISMFPGVRTQTQTKTFIFLWNESVDHSIFRSVGSLFHARGAATEKVLSWIRWHVSGMMRLSQDKACSADLAGISATCVSKSEMYSGMCPRSNLWCSKHRLYTGSSLRLVTSATIGEPESHGRLAWGPEQYMPQRAGLAEMAPAWKLEDQPARRYSSPVARGQVLWLVLLWHCGQAVYGRHVFSADGRNVWVYCCTVAPLCLGVSRWIKKADVRWMIFPGCCRCCKNRLQGFPLGYPPWPGVALETRAVETIMGRCK